MKHRGTRKKAGTHHAAFNLGRLKRPTRRDDLRRCLLPEIDPATQTLLKGFENRRQCRAEKARRVRSLERYARELRRQDKREEAREVIRLAKLLRRAKSAKDLPSFANPLFMRQFRRRFSGEILRLLWDIPVEEVRIYTIASPKWRLPAPKLADLDPRRPRESLRTNLINAGIDQLPGWLIVCFHNEHDRSTDTDQPHFHVVVVGEKYVAIEALRELDMFKSCKEVHRPIVCQTLVHAVRQISYLPKGYWLQTSGKLNEATGKIRRYRPRRLREPRHAESILFLHRQCFADLVWMHNISIKDGRLLPKLPK